MSMNTQCTIFFCVASILVVVGGTLTTGSLAMAETTGRPSGNGPTTVSVAVSILDVDEIDGAEQNFTANVYFELRWHDPRLSHDGPREKRYGLHEIWHPRVVLINQQFVRSTFQEIAYVAPNGEYEKFGINRCLGSSIYFYTNLPATLHSLFFIDQCCNSKMLPSGSVR
jgi:hypothetical protein